MSNQGTVRLGDVCIKGSSNIKQSDLVNNNGDYPIYGASGFIKNVDFYTQDKPYIGVVKDGAGVGRVMKLPALSSVIGTMQYIIPNDDIDVSYLAYAMEHMNLSKYYMGAAIPHIYFKDYKNEKLPNHTSNEQAQIVHVLDLICNQITKRNEQLSKLDELVKSRFVEMFGDWSINPYKYDIEALEKHIDVLSGFPFDSALYVEDGINICGGLIIMPHQIKWNECKHWKTTYGYEDYMLCMNDIVMALDRPWIGEGFKIAKIDKTHLPALLIQRTARIRAIDINQEYLYYCFDNCGFENHCNITGSLVPHISLKDIKSFEIMIPPKNLQNQFADFVTQVEKQKATVQQSIDKLETLKKSLMQEYFG